VKEKPRNRTRRRTLVTRDQMKKAFNAVSIEPREADYSVVEMLGGDFEELAEYAWDHWMGEPSSPTVRDVQETMEAAVSG
jgi:hypothetical protein